MGLATEIVKFFSPHNLPKKNERNLPTSIGDFNNAVKGLNIMKVVQYCKILEREKILLKIGTKDQSLVGPCYVSIVESPKNELNESYDLLCEGFLAIRNNFENSVFPVIAHISELDLDIGTAFYLRTVTGFYIITAFHCVDKMINIQIPVSENDFIKPKRAFKSSNKKIDIAVLEIDSLEKNHKPLFTDECKILDEILTIGYPPIPGFDAFQIAELSTINSTIRASRGNVLGNNNSYLDGLDYLLINARVKGGNSGSPIISKLGYACGVLVNIPSDPNDKTKLDDLGYGLGLSSKEIEAIINGIGTEKTTELNIDLTENGFKIK